MTSTFAESYKICQKSGVQIEAHLLSHVATQWHRMVGRQYILTQEDSDVIQGAYVLH